MALAVAILASGCRLGFDLLPGGGASDDGGPEVDADPLAVDAAPIDAVPPDAAPDAAPATATESQSGVTVPESASDLISIDPVLLTESFVTCSRRSTASTLDLNLARCQLLDGSSLRIESAAKDSSAVTSWTVLQVPGAVVQRGTETFATNDLTRDITITSVDPARTFALVSTSSPLAAVDNDERGSTMIQLVSDTTVRLTRGSIGAAATIDFQIIQFPSTSVQSGVVNMGIADLTKSDALAPTVDLSRTFVVHSTSIGSDVDGAEAVYMTASGLSATDVTFSRKVSGEPLQVSWFAVELPVTSTVKTQQVQSVVPHDQLVFEFSDNNYTEGMISFSSLEIDSGILRTSLNAASFTSVISAGKVSLERNVSDGSQIRLRTTVVDIVMP